MTLVNGFPLMSDNPYEKQNRFKKATLIAEKIEQSDLSIEQIVSLSRAERDILAVLAGVNSPSEETWKLVLQLVEKRIKDPLAD